MDGTDAAIALKLIVSETYCYPNLQACLIIYTHLIFPHFFEGKEYGDKSNVIFEFYVITGAA